MRGQVVECTYLSIYLSIYLSTYLSACLSGLLGVFVSLFVSGDMWIYRQIDEWIEKL